MPLPRWSGRTAMFSTSRKANMKRSSGSCRIVSELSDHCAATRIYRLPLFVARNFKSSTFARINFKSGDVFASL